MRYGAQQFGYTFAVPTENENNNDQEELTPLSSSIIVAGETTNKKAASSSEDNITESSKLVSSAKGNNNNNNNKTEEGNDEDYRLMSTSGESSTVLQTNPTAEEEEGQQQQSESLYTYIPPPKKRRDDNLQHDSEDSWGDKKGHDGGSGSASDQAPVALSVLGACCCCITAALVIAGGILVAFGGYENSRNQDDDKNGDKFQFIGSIVLVVSAGSFLIGCCSCCFGCVSSAFGDGGGGSSLLGGGGGGGDHGGGDDRKEVKVHFKRLNDRFEAAEEALEHVHLDLIGDMKEVKEAKKKEDKMTKDKDKEKRKQFEERVKTDLESGLDVGTIKRKYRPVAFLIRFHGDLHVSESELLRKQVSTIVKVGRPKVDQAIIVMASPGGSVSDYGLASSQLVRIRKAGIKLIVCVDTVAASGGYMMASVGDVVCAAPFAMIGSIGVVTQIPNFHRFLDKHSIDAFLFTAGKYKRTVDVIGEVTDEGKEKLQEELDDIHRAFKDHVALARPRLKDTIEDVATGEYWLAVQAKEKGLVDEIMTSDEYIESISAHYDVIEIAEKKKKSLWSALHHIQGMKSIVDWFSFIMARHGDQRGQPSMPMAIA